MSEERIATVKLPFEKRELTILAALLLVAFVVRLVFFPISGFVGDTNTNISWPHTAADYGPRTFYNIRGAIIRL